MVGKPARRGKRSVVFAKPPWTEQSALWIAMDKDLSPNHLVREIRETVERLDLTSVGESYSCRGKPPYPIALMLSIILYELRCGRRKPCQWFRDTRENSPLRWLGFGIRPSRSCWYETRDRLQPYLDALNQQVLTQAVEQELTTAEYGALDGSAVAANASRRRSLNEDRLQDRMEKLAAARQRDAQDQIVAEIPGWMAKTPDTRAAQQDRYQQAWAQLHKLLQTNEKRSASERRERKKVIVSAGDPEAVWGLDKDHVYRPLYNVQIVRDVDSPFILAYDVLPQATDAATLQPMLERSHALTGRRLKDLLVDCGYVTGCDLAVCQSEKVTLYGPWKENDYSSPKPSPLFSKDDFLWLEQEETYRCPAGELLRLCGREKRVRSGGREETVVRYRAEAATCQACSLRAQCTTSTKNGRSIRRSEHEDLIVAHRQRMASDEAKAIYRVRGQTIEIVYADWKEHRGLRRFSGRGLNRARAEVALEVLVHNLLALVRAPPKPIPVRQCASTPEKTAL